MFNSKTSIISEVVTIWGSCFTKNKIETSKSPFLAISLYKDRSGLLTNDDRLLAKEKKGKLNNSKNEDELDDEDELLYGSSDFAVGMFGVSGGPDKGTEDEEEGWKKHLEVTAETFWLIGVRENGNMELYSVLDFKLSFIQSILHITISYSKRFHCL